MTTNHFDARPHMQPNGDPGGEDKFDGGCPSDTVTGQIVPESTGTHVFGILSVYKHGTPALHPCVDHVNAATTKARWDAGYPDTNHHVVTIAVPPFKERK